jgi:hypothetical protein
MHAPQRTSLIAISVALSALLFACSSDDGFYASDTGSPDTTDQDAAFQNEASESVEGFNGASPYLQEDMQRAAEAVSGATGLFATVEELEALDLTNPVDQARWGELTAQFEQQLMNLEQSMAGAALSAIEMAEHEAELQQMRLDALATTSGMSLARPKLISLATVFIVTTAAITVTRIYRNIRDVTYRNQNIPVRRVATTSEEGRQAIVDALESQGVDVPPGATGEEVADLFEEQGGRYVRAHVSQVARTFNVENADAEGELGYVAADNMEAQIDDNAQAARDCGVVATDAVVNLSTAGPTGLGAGVEGTMLVLTATERTPNDYINRHVDAVVAAQERQALETTEPTVPVEEARQRLEEAAEGTSETVPTPEEAEAFVESMVAALREQAEQFAPLTTIPMRIAFGTTTLENDPEAPEGPLRAEMTTPGFVAGEAAEILLVREDAQPIEVASHPLGPTSPLAITHTPLLGTLQVAAVPQGPEVDGVRMWNAEIAIQAVPQPTQIVVDGVNVVVTPRVVNAMQSDTFVVSVEAYEDATLRARRLDTGESYLMALTSEDDQDQCGGIGTFACGSGEVICADIVCNGTDDCGDGSDEAGEMCGDETHCCVATQGCPSETGSSCAETCCCCPYGEVCDRENFANGCVPE